MSEQIKFGKIKVYGQEIDLDNTSLDDLEKIRDILSIRATALAEKYLEISKKNNI